MIFLNDFYSLVSGDVHVSPLGLCLDFYSLVSGDVHVSPLGLCLFFWSFSVFSLLCC